MKHFAKPFLILFFLFLFDFRYSLATQIQQIENQDSDNNVVHSQRLLFYEIGISNSRIEGKDSANFSNPRNLHIGVSFDWLGNEKSVFELGVKYRNLALSSEFSNTDSFKVDYLLLAANYKYYYSGRHNNSAFGKVGLINSIAANHQELRTGPTTSEKVNSWENSLWASVGYKFHLSPKYSFFLEGAWNHSMQSLFEKTDVVRRDLLAVIGIGKSI